MSNRHEFVSRDSVWSEGQETPASLPKDRRWFAAGNGDARDDSPRVDSKAPARIDSDLSDSKLASGAATMGGSRAASNDTSDAGDSRQAKAMEGLAKSGVFASRFASEEQREPAYRAELLELFRQRLRLVAALTMGALPLFLLLHITLSSSVQNMLVGTYAGLFALCFATRVLARRMTSLNGIRMLSLLAYSLFCLGAGLVVSLLGERQIYILGGHNHIVLTVLLLPYSVWECLAIGVIAIGALAWSGWWALYPQQSHLFFSHLFVLCTTTVFVVIIARFQSGLYRRAFDTAFDLGRAAQRLQMLSFLDTLTGGFNRRYLETVLETEIARAVRFERPLSIIMFDLDNFKTVNDTRGHAAGDEVLCEVWAATLATIREVDFAARYGGDEFSIVLPETDEDAARAIAQRLQETSREHLTHRFGPDARESQVTLSIGIITARPRETVPFPSLLELADQRLYAAKRAGKNQIAA